MFARILQDRLQKLAEEELPESQCGFRKDCGCCSDMIFTVRQLVEKSWEHRAKMFFLFIDLEKAYDSVPRAAMWSILGKLGVPELTIELIKTFHQDTQAKIRVDGDTLNEIDVRNGLRQGCCLALVLFNLHICMCAGRWTDRIDGVGVQLSFKLDEKLKILTQCRGGKRTMLLSWQLLELELRELFRSTCMSVAQDLGLSVSMSKSTMMVTGREVTEEDTAPICVGVDEIECVSTLGLSGHNNRKSKTGCVSENCPGFGTLRRAVFGSRDLTKRSVYQACVLSVLLYGSECWSQLKRDLRKLDSFHHWCIRIVFGISNRQQWAERITSRAIRER